MVRQNSLYLLTFILYHYDLHENLVLIISESILLQPETIDVIPHHKREKNVWGLLFGYYAYFYSTNTT